jgi:uncharacterized protein YjbJ (UPF0337 family)
MKLSTKYQVKGMFRVAKGTVKVIAGKISSNTKLGVTGKIERFAGNVQRKIGKAQGFIGL